MTRDEIITAQISLRNKMDRLSVELKEADANWPWSDEQIVHLQSVQDELKVLQDEFNALTAQRHHF